MINYRLLLVYLDVYISSLDSNSLLCSKGDSIVGYAPQTFLSISNFVLFPAGLTCIFCLMGKLSYNLQLASISHVPTVTQTSGDDEGTPTRSTISSDVVLESLEAADAHAPPSISLSQSTGSSTGASVEGI